MQRSLLTQWRALEQRLRTALLGVPVAVKVIGIALGMAGVLSAGLLWPLQQAARGTWRQEEASRTEALVSAAARHCAAAAAAGATAELERTLTGVLAQAPHLAYLILEGPEGITLAEARASQPPERGLPESVIAVGEGPWRLRAGLHPSDGQEAVARLTRRLVRTTALSALLGVLAAWWLTRLFAHPIEELVQLTRAVKAGDYTVKAPVRAADEVGELAAAFNDMTEGIAQKEATRQRLLRQVLRAAEEERRRVARELHDHTGQSLTSLIALLGALESQCEPGVLRQRLAEIREHVELSLREVHDLSVALRPSVLDDVGLMPALERHCRTFARRVGVEVVCAEDGLADRRLPPEVELTLYRVVQEALTNAVRHGQAQRIRVDVQRTATGVLATVRDNGRGFEAQDWLTRSLAENKLGLVGIEERVTLLGGSFCVESQPGRGATVYADIPWRGGA